MIATGQILQQRYRIDKQIGQGGMGSVYVATDERFGSTVAIKETLYMDDNYRKAIEREARLLNSLKHPALPRVSDHFEEENSQFIVMEYVPGEDLSAILERDKRPFAVAEVLDWADQLLDALDYLHNQENPVIHRDIKPQNLKVTPKGKIVLLDFGLAKGNPTDAGNNTAAKSIFGYSRNYASLEQIQGTGTDPRSDLYALAATLYHLVTGYPPDDALTRAMNVLGQKGDPLKPADSVVTTIPRGIAGILSTVLDLNAANRPASAKEMRSMLKDVERFEHLGVPDRSAIGMTAAADTHIDTQRTRLMPETTRADDASSSARTMVMDTASELTSIRDSGAHITPYAISNAEHDLAMHTSAPIEKRRRRILLSAAAALLVAAGLTGAGAIYLTREGSPATDIPAASAAPPAAVPVTDGNMLSPTDRPVTDTGANADKRTLAKDQSKTDTTRTEDQQIAKKRPAIEGVIDNTDTIEGVSVDDLEDPKQVIIRKKDKNGRISTVRVNADNNDAGASDPNAPRVPKVDVPGPDVMKLLSAEQQQKVRAAIRMQQQQLMRRRQRPVPPATNDQ